MEIHKDLPKYRSLTLHKLWTEYIRRESERVSVQLLLRSVSQVVIQPRGAGDAYDMEGWRAIVRGLFR